MDAQNPHSFLGNSGSIIRLRQVIDKVSRLNVPILLQGETGVGKEVVARAIQACHGTRPSQSHPTPFVVIDCSTLIGPLMESELFGHVKGAFTGAVAAKMGLIERADGGTAFFDEIGELPLELQAKLLRVLQEHEYRQVGSTTLRRSRFRIIAASNRDLAIEVERGSFRRDLYYRLNVFPISIPPLRKRKEDILLLTSHFLSRYTIADNVLSETQAPWKLSPEVVAAMLNYEWPGNVRELANCVRQMMAVGSKRTLHFADMPQSIHDFMQARNSGATVGDQAPPIQGLKSSAVASILPLSEVEHNAIVKALESTQGDCRTAARLLGIGRTTLYRKLKTYRTSPIYNCEGVSADLHLHRNRDLSELPSCPDSRMAQAKKRPFTLSMN